MMTTAQLGDLNTWYKYQDSWDSFIQGNCLRQYVADLQDEEFGEYQRTGKSLKRKSNAVVKKTHPTGYPGCPGYVGEALLV